MLINAMTPPTKTMMFRGSVFHNWVDNLIDLDLANGTVNNAVTSYSYTNFGRARTAGGQVDARLKPAPWLTAESSYAYTWTRDDVNVGGAADARRKPQHRGFHRIVVHDQIERRELMPPRQTLQREVLDPHARMKQLGLMSRHDQTVGGVLRYRLVRLTQVVARGLDHGGARFPLQLGQRPEKNFDVGGQADSILVKNGADLVEGRDGDDGAIAARGAERHGQAHRHVPSAVGRPR